MKNIKPVVYIVDDNPGICKSLRFLLESVGLSVETFSCGEDFLKAYNQSWRGCILIDIRMPVMSGLELQEHLTALHNKMPIIIITGHGDVPLAVRAMKSGAVDFISKPFNDQMLLEQIQKAILKDANNGMVNDKRLELLKKYNTLTKREREVMQLVVEGRLNKTIALELGIANKTVEIHRSNLMKKMQVRSLAELINLNIFLSKDLDLAKVG